ncbi:MAG: hypothetical protein JW830_05785, partial [Bacteroidales bacterium]|nr:hypothetical protein [Bacteroidales bacterium]
RIPGIPASYTIMGYRIILHSILFFSFSSLSDNFAFAQQAPLQRGSVAYFDSINRRIDNLQNQVARLKQSRDVSYYNMQRELDLTIFVKAYEEYVVDEEFEMAREMVEQRLERAEFRKDQYSLKFYHKYRDDAYALIKSQRMYYQDLFQKEKNFKREFERFSESGVLEDYQKAQRMVDLALKYARENNLAETVKYLEVYQAYAKALIFDHESVYDLASLTNNEKEFQKVFQPLIASDTLDRIKEAEGLLAHCTNYGRLTNSALKEEFFRRQELLVSAALSDKLEKEGREKELARYTNQAVTAKFDTLNPRGVFKWHDQVIVIDEFIPTSGIENVKKGEAIMHADKMLAAYLQKNKLCASVKDLKFGYAFIIPYKSNAKNTSFYYNTANKKWQYIACYTLIVSPNYTQQVSKFMPPLFFEDEMDSADNQI